MSSPASRSVVLGSASQLADIARALPRRLAGSETKAMRGICGFDGFIDTIIQVQQPATMVDFGGKVTAAAGISASYPVIHVGDRFGGNGPLLTRALHGLFGTRAELTYIGALGDPGVLPIFAEVLAPRTRGLHSLANPAHSDCLEFRDGKIMLSDLRSCAEVTWERLLERVPLARIDALLRESEFIAAANWGKLVHAGVLWRRLAERWGELGVPAKERVFFMDLAEFEQRTAAEKAELPALFQSITAQCTTLLSLNLKEAWQLAEVCGLEFVRERTAVAVADVTRRLRAALSVDRVIVHPNDGAACASADGCVYIPGPLCRDPLVSIGAGDHFGAGCLAGALCGLSNIEILLIGCCTSGYFVRSGRAPSLVELCQFAMRWVEGPLPERL